MAAIQQYPHSTLRRHSPFQDQHALQSRAIAKQELVSDSDSDDEPPPALKFSKVTEALLNDRLLPSSPIKHSSLAHRPLRSITTAGATLSTPDRRPGIKILRKSSPSALEARRGSTPPRIVHVGSGQKGSARRTVSIAGPYPNRIATSTEAQELVTPAPARLLGSTRPRAGSNASQDGHQGGQPSSSGPASRNGQSADVYALAASLGRATSTSNGPESVSRFTMSTLTRPRANGDSALPTGSQRVKRAPIAGSTFLKSGPMRRGFRRRESEEEVSPSDDYNAASHPSSQETPHHGSTRSDGPGNSTRATSVEPDQHAPLVKLDSSVSRPSSRQSRSRADAAIRPPSRQADSKFSLETNDGHRRSSIDRQLAAHSQLASATKPAPDSSAQHEPVSLQRSASLVHRSYRYITDAADDQENAPPPTFRRNKEQELKHLGRDPKKTLVDAETPVSIQKPPERKALHAVSNNTPHRAAPPPPPKISVIETATATVGASTTKSRKKRTHIIVNGKIFTQMGRIGKGGSSEVFLVMAENYKTFALKKVRLDNCDESAVRGFKGEIDLLKKLTEVDRVIRLYDWELNEEKQELLVLMEKGDTDLYRIMTVKNGGHDGKFDLTFTRYYWKEMLECVQSVHEHDIVHSDLKPANFLVVQGRLKLIDFGIANAIEVDHTCNVHRDSHVGTPNYMSPESINDTSGSGHDAQGRPLRKDMKIGKSSDVWSLGCILYQMTYGRPPFAHIPTIPRIMAITNPKHIIEFPDTGIGGVVVPASLKGVLKRCLQREASVRPTIPQLLSDTNEFLHREANGAVMMRQDVLEHIINKVVERCQDSKRGMPSASEVAQYAPDFMDKVRALNERVQWQTNSSR